MCRIRKLFRTASQPQPLLLVNAYNNDVLIVQWDVLLYNEECEIVKRTSTQTESSKSEQSKQGQHTL